MGHFKYNTTGLNIMHDPRKFLEKWHDPHCAGNHTAKELVKTSFGNIIKPGTVNGSVGHALSRHHAKFADAIEPGVLPLVMAIIEHLSWVTYTSCEGHYYGAHRPKGTERHVGILPCGNEERDKIRRSLQEIADEANRQLLQDSVLCLRVCPRILYSHRRRRFSVVDFVFVRRPFVSWESYLAKVDVIQQETIRRLMKVRGHRPFMRPNPAIRPSPSGGARSK